MLGRLDRQTGLRTGVWIPNRGYTRVFGVQAAATHGCLESQLRLHTGVWNPKRAIVQVASPNNDLHLCMFFLRLKFSETCAAWLLFAHVLTTSKPCQSKPGMTL